MDRFDLVHVHDIPLAKHSILSNILRLWEHFMLVAVLMPLKFERIETIEDRIFIRIVNILVATLKNSKNFRKRSTRKWRKIKREINWNKIRRGKLLRRSCKLHSNPKHFIHFLLLYVNSKNWNAANDERFSDIKTKPNQNKCLSELTMKNPVNKFHWRHLNHVKK